MNLKLKLIIFGLLFCISGIFAQTVPSNSTKLDSAKIKKYYPDIRFNSHSYKQLEEMQWKINRIENPPLPMESYYYDENLEYYYLDSLEEMECRTYYFDYFNQSYEYELKEEKPELPLQVHFGVNFATTLDKHTKSVMNSADYAASNYLISPISSGKIGLKNGVSVGGSIQPQFRFINRYMRNEFFFGYIFSCDFTVLQYGWNDISADTTSISRLINTAEFSNLYLINIGAGLTFTYAPDLEKSPFLINFFLKGGYNFIDGGEITSKHNNYKLSAYPAVNKIGFTPSFGFNMHLTRSLYLQVEYNALLSMQNRKNSHYYVEKLTIDETSYSDRVPISNQLKFNHLKLGIGINL